MTHAYHHFATACICGQPANHHVHTGSWDDCPCSRCELDRENAEIWGALNRWFAQQPVWTPPTACEDVPATFKPTEALR